MHPRLCPDYRLVEEEEDWRRPGSDKERCMLAREQTKAKYGFKETFALGNVVLGLSIHPDNAQRKVNTRQNNPWLLLSRYLNLPCCPV